MSLQCIHIMAHNIDEIDNVLQFNINYISYILTFTQKIKMSTSYLALTILVVFLILFIYFCFLSVSLRTIKSNEDESGKIALKNR